MLSLLGGLAHAIGQFVLNALIDAINVLIIAVGALVGLLLSALPDMPSAPTAPASPWIGWLNWLIPVAPMVAALSLFVGLWVAFLVIRIPLKWVKAL